MEKKWFKGKLVLEFNVCAEDELDAETAMSLALDDIEASGNNDCIQFDKWKDATIDIAEEAKEH